MQYLAFDVSKAKLDGVLTNLRTKTTYFSIENTPEAIQQWLTETSLPKKLVAGCEATSYYHLLLARTLSAECPFKVINPILTKQFMRATVRKQKTDQSDSLIIAKLLAQGEGNLFVSRPEQEAAKRALRLQILLGRYETGLRLAQGETPEPGLQVVMQSIRETLRMRYKELQAAYCNPELTLLQSIPGIGWKSAFAIWSEVGSIERFTSAKELVAFAGLDPRIRQSGHTLNSQGKLTKRGSPYLRRALFLAANAARRMPQDVTIRNCGNIT